MIRDPWREELRARYEWPEKRIIHWCWEQTRKDAIEKKRQDALLLKEVDGTEIQPNPPTRSDKMASTRHVAGRAGARDASAASWALAPAGVPRGATTTTKSSNNKIQQ
jgi:hypothetical protein